MRFSRTFILVLLSLSLGESWKEVLHAQSYNFKRYSAEQGLTSLNIDAIFQDSKGNLLIGGYGGLSKFNGKVFIPYSPKDELSNQEVTSIAEDSNGDIWVGTVHGLSKFEGRNFSIFTFTKRSGLAGDYITSIINDKNRGLWIGTTEGITLYNGKSFQSFTTKNGLISNSVSGLYRSSGGVIWIITDKGLSKIIPEKKNSQDTLLSNYRFANKIYDSSSPIAGSVVTSITEDARGNTWLGTDSGVVKYDGVKFTTYTTQDGLSDDNIQAVAKDEHSNDIWVGTSNGLNKISTNGKIEIFKIKNVRNGNDVTKLFVDEEGNIWLGTHNGLYRFRDAAFCTFSEQDGLKDSQIEFVFRDRKKNLWVGTKKEGVYLFCSPDLLKTGFSFMKNFSEKDGLFGKAAKSCTEDKMGNIWIGTNKGVFIYNGKTFNTFREKTDTSKEYEITAIMQDRKGKIWLGSDKTIRIWNKNKSTVQELQLQSVEPKIKVYREFEDSKGNVWIGTRAAELFRYDNLLNDADGQSKNIVNFSQKLNLKGKSYFAIAEDKEGILYFGSFDGVYIYDPLGKKLHNGKQVSLINVKDGLSSNQVYAMAFDTAKENLYIGTNQGLNKFDVKEFKKSGKIHLRQYGLEDGLNSLDFNPNGIWPNEDGTFWLGTSNGLVFFNPDLVHVNHIESKTSINGIRIFYKDTFLLPNSELQPDENNISFEYTGICLTNPGKVRYEYMLNPSDKTWSPETKENVIRFSNLPVGEFTFSVKSCNNEGLWNKKPAVFSFSIKPHLWQTKLFWVTISLIIIILLGSFFKVRAEAIRRDEAEKLNREIQLANNELKALRAQMDPHFIFNSLNSIQSFIVTKDEQSALRYLNKFAKLMRMILSNSEKASITIREEIDSLKLYLELESLRWDNKFDFVINIDPGIEIDFHILPSMLIQPYAENAILHGVVPQKNRPGKIEITITQNERYIICTISDNGIGRRRSQELRSRSNRSGYESMGMKITSGRLEVLNRIHHSDLNVKITDLEDETGNSSGTKVELFIPIS